MPRIFISHSSSDNDAAADLVSWLKAQGFETIFLDFDRVHGIPPGDNWEQRLYSEIQKSTAIILLLTRNWFDSKWCFVEFTHARALGKSVLPVVVAPSGDQFIGDNLQKIFLTTNRDEGLARLLDRLKDIALVGPEGFVHPTGRAPYPGMMSFEEEDAAVFFGRGPETRETLEQLERIRRTGSAKVLQVYGESGSGKSSLLKAGLIPQLKRRQSEWIVVPVFRPGPTPLRELRAALRAACAITGKPIAPEDANRIDSFLADPTPTATAALVERLRDVRAGGARHDSTVLFCIDQFEETANIATPADREPFIRALATLLALEMKTAAIITLRAADLPQIGRVLDLPRQEQLIGPFPLERLPEIVRKPAEAVNLKIDDTLIAAIQRDASSADALPLVAFLLRRLYDRHGDDHRLTRAEYESLGDARSNLTPLETCIRDAADDAIRHCDPSDAERSALRDVFVPGLVRIEETSGLHTRRPLPAAEVSQPAARLVNALVDERLLVRRDDASIEVAHEALFRVWMPLRAWLEDEQEFLLALNRLEAALSDWRATPDQQRHAAQLTGLLLDRCENWLTQHPARFTPEQRSFIEISVEARDAAKRHNARTRLFVTLGSLAAAIALGFLALLANDQRTRSQQREQEAVAATREARWQTYVSDIRLAESQFNAGQLDMARATLEHAPDEWRNWEHGYLLNRIDGSQLVLRGHEGWVFTASFSPDGTRVVTASADNTARVWDAVTGQELALLRGHDSWLYTAYFSPDGTRVITASADKTARVWDADTGQELSLFRGHDRQVIAAAFSTDGTRVVTASLDHTARVWDADTGQELTLLQGHEGEVADAVLSADGMRVVTASFDQTARVWDACTGQELVMLYGHKDRVTSADFSSDGTRVVTASDDKTVRVWDAGTGETLTVLRGHGSLVDSAWFSSDGKRVITASWDGTARVWDAVTGQELALIRGHMDRVTSANFSLDGTRVITASLDKTARVWDANTGQELGILRGHEGGVTAASFSQDGTRVVTASWDGTARVWDAGTSHQRGVLRRGEKWVIAPVYNADWTRFVIASDDNNASIWDAGTGQELTLLRGHTDRVICAAFNPNGTRVITASWDNTVRIWDAGTGQELALINGHEREVIAAAFNMDGTRVVTASLDHTARVWDAGTGQELALLRGHNREVIAAAFNADGTMVVTASQDHTARVWDAVTGQEVALLQGHKDRVINAAFSSDGTRVVTASNDNTSRVWNATTGQELALLRGHESGVNIAAFSPDTTRVVTASADRTVRVWNAGTGQELVLLRRHDSQLIAAAFNPDGSCVITASWDGTVQMWDSVPAAKRYRETHERRRAPQPTPGASIPTSTP